MQLPEVAGRIDAVAIGTSAGGVEALTLLLPALRAGARIAVFVVIHIPRERPSLLSEIFASRCAVPVHEAEDKMPAQPGHVYFAPPDYHMLVDTGPCVALSVDEPVRFSRPSIDVLFESAAEVFGERLMGVILTGASEDGAAGLAAVARAGGLAVVQEPSSALADLLPRAAAAATASSCLLELDDMRELFARLG